MFAWLKTFLESARPGLENFIREYLPLAKQILLDKIELNEGRLHDYKDAVREALLKQLRQRGVLFIRDTWIELLLNFAHEQVRAEIERRLR